MSVLQQIKGSDVKSQEKYAFSVQDGKSTLDFGPFDTQDAANKTAAALKETGLTVSDVRVFWTVSTARSLATIRRAKMTPPADTAKSEGSAKAS